MRFRLIPLLLALSLFGFTRPTNVLAAPQVVRSDVEYTFGGPLNFIAKLQTDVPVKTVSIFIQPQGEIGKIEGQVSIGPQGDLFYVYDLSSRPLRAFSKIAYWYELTLETGEIFTSSVYPFFYFDNRFSWKELASAPFRVHWYVGDVSFAQSVLDIAQESLRKEQGLLALQPPAEVDIYVYDNPLDLQKTLALGGQNWVAGHADPDLGVMVVSLPKGPDQRMDTEYKIPHELMHILLYLKLTSDYNNLPAWLSEGLAYIAELSPNPDFQYVLERAHQAKTLIPIASLCSSIPQDASNALLAYAQATSFTRYLYRHYGSSGLDSLVTKYADGLDCAAGFTAAIGAPLEQVESQWRKDAFGGNTVAEAFGELGPWFFLLAAILIIFLVLIIASARRGKHRKGAMLVKGVSGGRDGG